MANTTTVDAVTVQSSITVADHCSDALFPGPERRGQNDNTSYTHGVAPKCAGFYGRTHTIAASTTLTLTLSNGSLLDFRGNAITLTKLHALRVRHTAASLASSVEVDPDATHAACDLGKTLKPGQSVLMDDPTGSTVTAATTDVLAIINNDAGQVATVEVEIMGE
jgi:hypothetical protein